MTKTRVPLFLHRRKYLRTFFFKAFNAKINLKIKTKKNIYFPHFYRVHLKSLVFYSEKEFFFYFLIFKVVNIKKNPRKAEEQSLRGKETGGLRAGKCET